MSKLCVISLMLLVLLILFELYAFMDSKIWKWTEVGDNAEVTIKIGVFKRCVQTPAIEICGWWNARVFRKDAVSIQVICALALLSSVLASVLLILQIRKLMSKGLNFHNVILNLSAINCVFLVVITSIIAHHYVFLKSVFSISFGPCFYMLVLAVCIDITHFIIQIFDRQRPQVRQQVQNLPQVTTIYAYPQMYQPK